MKKLNLKSINFQKYFKIILIVMFFSLFIAFILYQKLNKELTISTLKQINSLLESNHIEFFFYHFIALILLIISAIFPFGIWLFGFYFLFEIICISYNLIAFLSIYHLSGFIFSIAYIFLTKVIYLILIFFFFKNCYKTFKILKEYLKDNKSVQYTDILNKRFHIVIGIIIALIINDLLIYFFANSLLYKLSFILA